MYGSTGSPNKTVRIAGVAVLASAFAAGCGSEAEPPPPLEAAETCSSKWQSLLTWDNPFRNVTEVRVKGDHLYVASDHVYRRPLAGGAFDRVAEVGESIGDFRIGEDGGVTVLQFRNDGFTQDSGRIDVMAFPAGGAAPVRLHTLEPSSDAAPFHAWGPVLLDRDAVYATKNLERSAAVMRADLATGVETTLLHVQPEGDDFTIQFRRAWNSNRWIVASQRTTWAAPKTGGEPVLLASRSENVLPLGVNSAAQVLWWEVIDVENGRLMLSTPEDTRRVPMKPPTLRTSPQRAWPLDDGGWVVWGHERFIDGQHLSLWRLKPEGGSTRIACDPLIGRYAEWGQATASGFYLELGLSEVVYVPWE